MLLLSAATWRDVPAEGLPVAPLQPSPSEADEPSWQWLGTLDEASLRELDELLLDPVQLRVDDVQRLYRLPWITAAQVRSLAAALPLQSLDQWTALSFWSTEDVERVLPFVRLQFTGQPRVLGALDAHVLSLRSGQRLAVRMQTGPISLEGKRRDGLAGVSVGFLQLQRQRLSFIAGDLRYSTGHGLMWSSRVVAPRAGNPVAMSERWLGAASFWRDRSVRGVSGRWRTNRFGVTWLQGMHATAPLRGGTITWQPTEQRQVQFALLQRRQQTWNSLFWREGGRSTRIALEVVHQPQAWSAAITVQRRLRPWTLEALIIVAPQGVSSPLSVTSSTTRHTPWRHLRGRASVRFGHTRLRGSWSQSRWFSGQSVRQQGDFEFLAINRDLPVVLEVQLRDGLEELDAVGAEGIEPLERRGQQRLLLRAKYRLRSGAILTVARRSLLRTRDGDSGVRGIGWQFHLERAMRRASVACVVSVFDAVPGAAIALAEPGVGGGPALYYGVGQGMRLALRLRLKTWRTEWAIRAATGRVPTGTWQPIVEMSMRLRLPAADRF
jgi:hypothetical protein